MNSFILSIMLIKNKSGKYFAIFFQKLCDLACKSPILDICNAKRLPGTPEVDASKIFPMMWRFFPTLDPQVYFTSFLHLIRIHCRICNQ